MRAKQSLEDVNISKSAGGSISFIFHVVLENLLSGILAVELGVLGCSASFSGRIAPHGPYGPPV